MFVRTGRALRRRLTLLEMGRAAPVRECGSWKSISWSAAGGGRRGPCGAAMVRLSAPLLSLSSGLASFPGVEERGFQLAISRRPCRSGSEARCRFPSVPFFFSGKLSFERRFLGCAFCCFFGSLLGHLPRHPSFLGGPALRNPDLSGGDHGFPGRFALGKSRIVHLLTMPLQQFLFGGRSGLLPFS